MKRSNYSGPNWYVQWCHMIKEAMRNMCICVNRRRKISKLLSVSWHSYKNIWANHLLLCFRSPLTNRMLIPGMCNVWPTDRMRLGDGFLFDRENVPVSFTVGSCQERTLHLAILNERNKSVRFNAAKYAAEFNILRKERRFQCKKYSVWSSQICRPKRKLNKNVWMYLFRNLSNSATNKFIFLLSTDTT